MAKSSRFKYSYRSNASKLHKAVGDSIRNHPLLKQFQAYQEYPVNKINPEFRDGRCKYDWVIPELYCVIEIHGQQHYKETPHFHPNPGDFLKQQERDRLKKKAAEDVGYTYIEVKYDEKLDVDELIDLAISNNVCVRAPKQPPKTFKKKFKREVSPEQKEKAKKLRQEAYQRSKEWKKKNIKSK